MIEMKSFMRIAIVLIAAVWLSGCGGGGNSGGSVTSWGELNAPAGFSVNRKGGILIADTNNHRIQEFTSSGSFLSTWGEEGTGSGQFSYPAAVAVDPLGSIYVADTLNNRIQKFDARHNFVLQWGTQGNKPGQFIVPFDLAVDSAGNIYVVDSGNSRIQVFSNDGQFIRTWGKEGSGSGQLLHPGGIAISSSGLVYVADTDNHRIQVFSDTGEYVTGWGEKGSGSGQFLDPLRIDLDAQENAYIVDNGNARLQKFSSTGSYLGEWGGAAGGQFTDLYDIIIGASRSFLLDEKANKVHVFDPQVVQPKTGADNKKGRRHEKTATDKMKNKQQTGKDKVDNSNWMSDLSATIIDKNLKEVVIPGTHDTGTWAITPNSAWAHDGNPNHAQQVIDALNKKLGSFSFLLKPFEKDLYDQCVVFQAGWSKTQYQCIGDQLTGGIRYLDFRVSWEPYGDDNGTAYPEGFYLDHSMRGDTLQNALNNIRDFCRAHPKEIIILDVNHMYYNDVNGGMTESQLQAFDTMVTQTLVYENGKSMMVEEDNGSDISVGEIWNRGQQVLVFVYDPRLYQNYLRYWSSVDDVRSIWDQTDDLGNLRNFLVGEMSHIDGLLFHVSQSIRTEAEIDIINGALSWLYDKLNGHKTTQWILEKLANHYGYSTDAPQDILSFEADTLANISTYTGWIGAQYQGPKIQIINNFGDDVNYNWWLVSSGALKADGYVDYAKQLNINYFGDGGPTINLVNKTTLDDTTGGPPSIAALNDPDLTEYAGILIYGSMDSPRKVVTRGLIDQWNVDFADKVVLNATTSTFPTAGSIGNNEVVIAWTGTGNNQLNFTTTEDGNNYTTTYTDSAETSSSYPVAVCSYNGELSASWRGGDGMMNVKRYKESSGAITPGQKYPLSPTKYGTSLTDANGTLAITGVSSSGSFSLLNCNSSYQFSEGDEFPNDWTSDTVSVAYIHGYLVLAWIGGGNEINLYMKGSGNTWYKRTLQEQSPSAPCIANINGMLYLVWRGGDNRVNAAIVAGL
ncbi:MAG: 6-bladed beta-propeller [bacterium]